MWVMKWMRFVFLYQAVAVVECLMACRFQMKKTAYDSVLDTGDYKIYVDAVALNYMRGVEVDFIERGLG